MALRILSAIYSNWGFGIYELCRRFALQTQFFDLLTVEVCTGQAQVDTFN